ncbi:MAG: nitrate reductase [Candidatus Rokubacteria bacterium]|nr:nitrate reductase [Candidatus Rokubacteria bacterium]
MRARRLPLALLALIFALGLAAAEAQQAALQVPFVKTAIPVDPGWTGWKAAPAVQVPLMPQAVAQPWNLTPSIKQLRVQAVHNGTWIAFRISWKDATKNAVMYTDSFRDAVALMVPVGKAAPIIMGGPGERVLILHWKADWQEDIDRTFQDIAQLYPNAWQDWYPFVAGEPPYDITAWTNPEARRYLTGWVLGNPRSQPDKRTAVEEQIAEGFSTLTTTERQSAVGKGVYADGAWHVVIARPFAAGDPNDPAWRPGRSAPVAFAAWDGGAKEIGARKAISDWITLKLGAVGR